MFGQILECEAEFREIVAGFGPGLDTGSTEVVESGEKEDLHDRFPQVG